MIAGLTDTLTNQSFKNLDSDFLNYSPLLLALQNPMLGIKKMVIGQNTLNKKLYFEQIDQHISYYLKNIQQCLDDNPSEYIRDNLNKTDRQTAFLFLKDHLQREYPHYFQKIYSELRDEKLDKLINRIPSDICLIDKKNFQLKYAHLCCANQWSASWGIGKNFNELHGRLTDFQSYIPKVERLLAHLKSGEYFERLGGITLTTNPFLNRHPLKKYAISEKDFDPQQPELYLRFERQLLTLIPNTDLILFSIRTYITDLIYFNGDYKENLQLFLSNNQNSTQNFLNKNHNQIQTYLNLMENSNTKNI